MAFIETLASCFKDVLTIEPEFTLRLQSKCPSITSLERNIAVLVALEKKRDEIAGILRMNYKLVDKHRYNLRKKLGLQHSQDLRVALLALPPVNGYHQSRE